MPPSWAASPVDCWKCRHLFFNKKIIFGVRLWSRGKEKKIFIFNNNIIIQLMLLLFLFA
jgi:hypothetical protein